VIIKDKGDNELILEIKKSGCNDSFKELTSRHSNLYYKICQKYLPVLKRMGAHTEDIFNDVDYVFFKCLNSFDPSKNTKFSTWLGNYARYNCLNHINTQKKHGTCEELDHESTINDQIYKEEYVEDASGVEYIYSILSKLKDKRIIKVYEMRYEKNGEKKATWSEIAGEMSISTQTAINLHSRGRNMLAKKLRNKKSYNLI
jgi:RNA polymerase sigma factor (sigma-70 family)